MSTFEHPDEIAQELEVLESIYPEELTKISENELSIALKLEDPNDADVQHPLLLHVSYTPSYPNEPPDLSLSQPDEEDDDDTEPFLSDEDIEQLTESLRTVANESLGMAMVFTLSSSIADAFTSIVTTKREAAELLARQKAAAIEEAEREKRRGTPVTQESFMAWKKKFDVEMLESKKREEEEKLRAMPPKEREETRKWMNKQTGRQLFETNKDLDSSDAAFASAEDKEVDISLYEREDIVSDDEEDERVHLSDSD
ncbi:RWD-domain-containing protein [Atractiella rhizophila]|nr:RWD-domain-containing protein [Atractiella rhizophila]